MSAILILAPFEEYILPDELLEAKGLHSYRSPDPTRHALVDLAYQGRPEHWKGTRRVSSRRAADRFETVANQFRSRIHEVTDDFLAGKLSFTKWTKEVREALRDSYIRSFTLGLHSSGAAPSTGQGILTKADQRYIESAYRHELSYLNKLLGDVRTGEWKGDLEKRLEAYVETLKHIYYSGRVMSTPAGYLIDWISPLDRNTCKGCRWLAEQSPFTRDDIPTTPRAGDTRCLNHCRCRLLMREVSKELYAEVVRRHRSKDWYSRKLAALKIGRVLTT